MSTSKALQVIIQEMTAGERLVEKLQQDNSKARPN